MRRGLFLLHLPAPHNWQMQEVCLSPRILVVLTTSSPSSQGLPFLWSWALPAQGCTDSRKALREGGRRGTRLSSL